MKMQFKPYSESYYQAEKENMIYRISAVRNEPDGHTTAVLENTFGGNYIAYGCKLSGHRIDWAHKSQCTSKNRHLKRLCGQKAMITLSRRTEDTSQEGDNIP